MAALSTALAVELPVAGMAPTAMASTATDGYLALMAPTYRGPLACVQGWPPGCTCSQPMHALLLRLANGETAIVLLAALGRCGQGSATGKNYAGCLLFRMASTLQERQRACSAAAPSSHRPAFLPSRKWEVPPSAAPPGQQPTTHSTTEKGEHHMPTHQHRILLTQHPVGQAVAVANDGRGLGGEGQAEDLRPGQAGLPRFEDSLRVCARRVLQAKA